MIDGNDWHELALIFHDKGVSEALTTGGDKKLASALFEIAHDLEVRAKRLRTLSVDEREIVLRKEYRALRDLLRVAKTACATGAVDQLADMVDQCEAVSRDPVKAPREPVEA